MTKYCVYSILFSFLTFVANAQAPTQPHIILITMDDIYTMMEGYEYLPDTHYYSTPGIYTVTNYIQYGNGCLKSYNRTATLLREGLSEFNCTLYPNPANTYLNITLQSDLENAQVQILNALGETVFNENLDSQNKLLQLHIETLPAGSYFLEIRSHEVFTHGKFEIMR